MSRALVLAGGGVAGIAWLIGLIDALRGDGVDLADADVLIGTSAGSAAATQLATGQLAHSIAMQTSPTSTEIVAQFDMPAFLASMGAATEGAADRLDANRRMANVPTLDTGVSAEQRRAVVVARLPVQQWPGQPLVITAVDRQTGERAVFDRSSGVALLDAVCASCAVPGIWPPVRIGDRDYVDGGVYSSTNADLAAGHDRVLIVVPSYVDDNLAARIEQERRELGESLLVQADAGSVAALGTNPLDPANRRPAFEAGRVQASRITSDIGEFWNAS